MPDTADEAGALAVKQRTRSVVREVSQLTGSVVFFAEVGGLELAADQAGADYLARRAAAKQALSCHAVAVTAAEIAARWPMIRSDDVRQGVWTAGDWLVRSVYLAVGLAALARLAGVSIIEGCPVTARPLIGAWRSVPGLFLASGFGGGGVQRMASAEAVADQIAGTQVGVDVTEYRAARFAGYAGDEFPLWDGPYAAPTSGRPADAPR